MDRVFQLAVGRFARRLEAIAVDIEFPAVINAAQTAVLVATEEQRRAPMRAIGIHQPDAAIGIAKRDQILGHQPNSHRRAVAVGEFGREQRRLPESSQHFAGGLAAADPHETFVLFWRHGTLASYRSLSAAWSRLALSPSGSGKRLLDTPKSW